MTPTRRARRSAVVATGAAAGVMVLASAAFACTAFKGHMWVNRGSGAAEGHAIGNGTGMRYCPGTTADEGAVVRGTAFTVEIAPTSASDPCPNQSLTKRGRLQVLWTTEAGHCMAGTGNKIGAMPVTNGVGSGTYTIPASAQPGPGKVCVSENSAFQGMQVPVTIS